MNAILTAFPSRGNIFTFSKQTRRCLVENLLATQTAWVRSSRGPKNFNFVFYLHLSRLFGHDQDYFSLTTNDTDADNTARSSAKRAVYRYRGKISNPIQNTVRSGAVLKAQHERNTHTNKEVTFSLTIYAWHTSNVCDSFFRGHQEARLLAMPTERSSSSSLA